VRLLLARLRQSQRSCRCVLSLGMRRRPVVVLRAPSIMSPLSRSFFLFSSFFLSCALPCRFLCSSLHSLFLFAREESMIPRGVPCLPCLDLAFRSSDVPVQRMHLANCNPSYGQKKASIAVASSHRALYRGLFISSALNNYQCSCSCHTHFGHAGFSDVSPFPS
jgi:hypothetical protein